MLRVFLLLTCLEFVAEFLFGATGVLFFRAKGFSSGAVGLVLATYWWTEAVFELPTGVFADACGRKISVVASYLFRSVGYLTVATAPSVTFGVFGFFLVGVGSTFSSGAIEAWAVDESAQAGSTAGLDRLFGLAKMAENAGVVFGSVAGAALGMVTLAVPFFGSSALFALCALVATMHMTEGRPVGWSESRHPTTGSRSVPAVVRAARRVVSHDRRVVALLVFGAAPRVFGSVAGLQWSLYLARFVHGQYWLLGGIRSAGFLLQGGVAGAALWLLNRGRVGRRRSMAVGAGGAGLGLLLAAQFGAPAPAVLGYVLFIASLGAVEPGVRAALNEHVSSQERATMLSVSALITAVLTGLSYLLIGHVVVDLAVVHTSWTIGAVGIVTAGLPLALLAGGRRVPDPADQPVGHAGPVADDLLVTSLGAR